MKIGSALFLYFLLAPVQAGVFPRRLQQQTRILGLWRGRLPLRRLAGSHAEQGAARDWARLQAARVQGAAAPACLQVPTANAAHRFIPFLGLAAHLLGTPAQEPRSQPLAGQQPSRE